MNGISSSSISLLWNGSKANSHFSCERSSSIVRNGPKVSHFFFEDDVLLFAKAKVFQANLIGNLLERFCCVMKVSLHRSAIFASKGVPESEKPKILAISDIKFTSNWRDIWVFVCFMAGLLSVNSGMFWTVFNPNLHHGKGRLLNKLGRNVLVNSVISAFPTFGMHIQWFPQSICDYIDRVAACFIRKGSDGNGLHMVSWKQMTKHKKNGGLGVRVARHQNTALLGKMVWEFLNPSDKIWVSLLKDLESVISLWLQARKGPRFGILFVKLQRLSKMVFVSRLEMADVDSVYSSVTARKQLQILGRSNGVVVGGSVFMDSGLAGFGRLVRDETGHLQGFSGSLGNSS
ncbi:RNA-directed DNA polymerase (reverse transcriptase) [Trifolium pratense]|uniref:RNA-directed DNA polymerase (Reverse transcriptase) n=1 Tax=Trifolium pratense TaxID=57577 RepID=A0A2K3MS67_TRIPR|nr:RNA-directed DNA polymerase (reverse transcriptase) [Trifolium pratense]